MYYWLVLFVLLNQSYVCHSLWRIFYIAPSANLQPTCSANNCHSLEDVIKNQSYFIASDTVLELLPGKHQIKENIGNLVINSVSNFILKGSNTSVDSSNNHSNSSVASIVCLFNGSFGLILKQCRQITISGIHIKDCGTKLTTSTLDESGFRKLEPEEPQFCLFTNDWEYVPIPCYGTVVSLYGSGLIVQKTVITNSKGVGIFMYHSNDLSILSSHIAYNVINCMLLSPYGDTSFIDSKIMYGHQNHFNLMAGIYILGTYQRFAVNIINVTLFDNKGGFYLKVHMNMNSDLGEIHVVLYNLHVTERESYRMSSRPGISVEYEPYYTAPGIKHHGIHHRIIIIKQSHLRGSCIAIRNQKPLLKHDLYIEIRSVVSSESYCSSAVTVESTAYLSIENTSIIRSNYNIFEIVSSTVYFENTTLFSSNHGTFTVKHGNVTFIGLLQVLSNSPVEFESTFILRQSKITFYQNILFQSNSGIQGGAISAYDSILILNNSAVAFLSNSADNGGAISLKDGSVLRMYDNSTLYFYENHANHYGGGIYVEEAHLWSPDTFSLKCFVETNAHHASRIIFANNTAKLAGKSLFGGWIDMCEKTKPLPAFDFTANNSASNNFTEVSSQPSRVCTCTYSIPNTQSETEVEVFPGQTFELQAAAVGQRFGVTPAVVKAETENKTIIDDLERLQDVKTGCSPLKYTIRSKNHEERIKLTIDKRCTATFLPQQKWLKSFYQELVQLNIRIILKNCSLGFVFDSKKNICACHPALLEESITCNVTSHTVQRKSYQWISTTHAGDILINKHCPFDYSSAEEIALNLTNPDAQCVYGRSGTLCGMCSKGLTQVLGTSKCRVCSNTWLTLLLAFILAGAVLVVLLMALNLTVTVGTVNGLIFYANIVRANTAIFFPREMANTFPSWFIAWVNLDLGIETCFYDGLDAYAKTWLQFVFPLYIWFMMIVIIISSRLYITSGENTGNNAVQVLATLFLLSYAKLLRVAITIFHATVIYNSNGSNILVWSYDGNISYLGKEHISLFLTALMVTVFMVVPYTLILFNIQWLQAYSHYRPFFWINKFKPLFDAYMGPYKDKHRYWTGLLLLVRGILFATFSANTSGNPSANLLAIITSATVILTYFAFVGGVYKKWPLNLLECLFLFNLIILSTITLYGLHNINVSERHFIALASATSAFFITLFILAYHVILRFQKWIAKIKVVQKSTVFGHKLDERHATHSNTIDMTNTTHGDNIQENENLPKVTRIYAKLREPLLSN